MIRRTPRSARLRQRVAPILFTLLLLAACRATPTPFASPFDSPFDSPLSPEANAGAADAPDRSEPEAGMATFSGQLFSTTGRSSIPGTAFYLLPAQPAPPEGEELVLVLKGPDLEAGDVVGTSDADGNFTLTAVPPGEYYLAVWAPYTWIPIPADATDTMPRVFEVRAGDRLDAGRLELAWP
jgi:hypothetical protein